MTQVVTEGKELVHATGQKVRDTVGKSAFGKAAKKSTAGKSTFWKSAFRAPIVEVTASAAGAVTAFVVSALLRGRLRRSGE